MYKITFSAHGVSEVLGRVPASQELTLYGKPDETALRGLLPYRIRKAATRALWWQDKSFHYLQRRDLVSLRGQPMGTLFAEKEAAA